MLRRRLLPFGTGSPRRSCHWKHRAEELKLEEQAGKQPRMNWMRATAGKLNNSRARLEARTVELEQEKQVSPLAPMVIGGALVVPAGLFARPPDKQSDPGVFAKEKKAVELAAMDAVMEIEKSLGFEPRDVSDQKVGWDIESRDPDGGGLRFIEVKGRIRSAPTVTVTKNEILSSLNQPENFILALVQVDNESTECRYLRRPFEREPEFAVTSINYKMQELWDRAERPF